jgi:small subunit ribosomal protein S16
MLRIRLRRVGKKGRPNYRVVVAEQQAPRDGAFLETLGSYDPHTNPPSLTLNEDRAKEWMSKGAQPSEAAEKILRKAGVIEGEAPPRPMKPSKAELQAQAEAEAAATAAAPPAETEETAAAAPEETDAPAAEAEASTEEATDEEKE